MKLDIVEQLAQDMIGAAVDKPVAHALEAALMVSLYCLDDIFQAEPPPGVRESLTQFRQILLQHLGMARQMRRACDLAERKAIIAALAEQKAREQAAAQTRGNRDGRDDQNDAGVADHAKSPSLPSVPCAHASRRRAGVRSSTAQ